MSSLKSIVSKLPKKCGVYLFKNSDAEILYVGKANVLRDRVRQYFAGLDSREKIKSLVPQIADIEIIEVASEFEALLLEAALIKKHLPRYNHISKDDKHPLYIAITKEQFPKIKVVRRPVRRSLGEGGTQDVGRTSIFGPFPSSYTVRQVLKFLRRIFHYCSCRHNRGRPCLYSSIGLCDPCPRKILRMHEGSAETPRGWTLTSGEESSPEVDGEQEESDSIRDIPRPLREAKTSLTTRRNAQRLQRKSAEPQIEKTAIQLTKQYQKQMRLMKKLLAGDSPQVVRTLEREMNRSSKNRDYEQAAFYRDGLMQLKYLLQPKMSPNSYLENPNLRIEIRLQAVEDLKQILNSNGLSPEIKSLSRIECYDISTLSGKFSTGAMVVFTDGEADKSQYRRFKIKKEGLPNDVAMMGEMLQRRFAPYSPSPLQGEAGRGIHSVSSPPPLPRGG